MWFESQNCAMMGLQATTGKRKLEAATAPGESSPAKNGRWEAEDCIARLQAVAVPSDAWKAATLLSDDFEDDEDFEDDLSDDDRCAPSVPEPARFTQVQQHHLHLHHHHSQHHVAPQQAPTPYPVAAAAAAAAANANNRYPSAADYWQYYQPPQQQTIRCEENGKSYLELGAAPPVRTRCCDGRTRWCHVPCYRQRRLAVLNLSMCKLARYRQCSDPSLRRSVLICNTLRRLEREMESEPPEPSYPPPPSLTTTTATQPPEVPPPGSRLHNNNNHHHHHHHHHNHHHPAAHEQQSAATYEHSLREMTAASGRATPFPPTPATAAGDSDSGIGDDDATRPINWGSVLSLTSQTDLESLNNNELYAELGLTGSDFEWNKETSSSARAENEWDGFMHVLVSSS